MACWTSYQYSSTSVENESDVRRESNLAAKLEGYEVVRTSFDYGRCCNASSRCSWCRRRLETTAQRLHDSCTMTNQNQAEGQQQQQFPTSLEGIVTQITSSTSPAALADLLRAFSNNREGERELILASSLPGGQEPLELLDVKKDTVGWAFILYVYSFLGVFVSYRF